MPCSKLSGALPATDTETDFPNLQKLCRDFGLRVIRRNAEAGCEYFLVVDGEGENAEKLTPIFAGEAELEAYAAGHMIDILHRYLGEEQPNPDASLVSFNKMP